MPIIPTGKLEGTRFHDNEILASALMDFAAIIPVLIGHTGVLEIWTFPGVDC